MKAPFPSPTATWRTDRYEAISPSRPELSAKGKTILITGGGTGIGRETAICFAEAGASRIAILGRREQPLHETKAAIGAKYPGVEIFAVSADVTKKREVDAAFAKFAKNGSIDVLVSNAAMIGSQEPVLDLEAGEFLDSVQQNLMGSFHVAQAFGRHAARNAIVIEVNSFVTHLNVTPRFAGYSVAKTAVCRLWDLVAVGNHEYSVFHIQPGTIDTDMNKEAGGVAALGFADTVALPASFCVWLASPEAQFLKGKYLWVNWDVEELKSRAKELEETTQLSIDLVGWPFGDAWNNPWKDPGDDKA